MFRTNALPALACLPLLLLAAAMQSGSCRAGAGANAPSQGVNKISKQGSPHGSNRNDNANSKDKMKDSPEEKKTEGVADGMWGGNHIRLTVRDDGANVEYDCARGTITEPPSLDSEGRFDLTGTLIRDRPGPIILGEQPDSRPARYSGSVSGETMTLTVRVAGESKDFGAFTLTRGSRGRVTKCR